MKYIVILFFSLALLSTSAYAQEYKKHTVQKGETVVAIAKKYKVTPYDIYRLNPDSKNGINENTTLLIPAESKTPAESALVKEQPTKVANTIHEVQAKETLYSLSKQYNVSVEDIKKANGTAVDSGLQIGQKVIIPIKGSGVAAQVKTVKQGESKDIPAAYFYHTVAAGDTKYSIAKQYGMSLQLLEELNPEVKETLPLGYKLKLDKNTVVEKETQPEPLPVKPQPAKEDYMTYEVQPKETFYSLSKRTGLTEEKIIALNPEAKGGLKDGMILRLPKGDALMPAAVPVTVNRPLTGLAATLNKSNAREIALLLPFNMARVEQDSTRAHLLRSDKFLNMTLDFYAGALMAIDSAKVLGLPLKVRIMDSKETKTTSDVNSLAPGLGSANAVIGPFYPGNVESVAALLAGKKIAVISPMSKEATKPYPNLFQSIPKPDRVKQAMLDYLKSKDGNIIAVVDAKKGSSKEYIKTNCPEAKFAALSADGTIMVEALKSMLVKDKMNYVILETERMGMVLGVTKALADALPNYQIQLAVLDKNETLDNDELPLARLTSLKLLYPSVTRDNETAEAAIFAKDFKEKNGIFPNQYAIRGFDVTFDVILRLFQEEGFAAVMDSKASEQVENKFAYNSENGGNYNTGVYIMYYDQDLSVKEAQ
jgi:LysM repeat protein/ABC-type branched-subunit amino acid transport system substrate-binding protein